MRVTKTDRTVVGEAKRGKGRLVTNDAILVKAFPKIAMTVEQAFEAAEKEAGKTDPASTKQKKGKPDSPGTIALTPESMKKLGTQAVATHDGFLAGIRVTEAQARVVRRWRVDSGYSWRAVADAFSQVYDGDWGDNQLAGLAICEMAAAWFKEDYLRPPWN